MLEQLCMQEVSQIILSKPDGAVIPGKNYRVGEPIMIINNPALSSLSFLSKPCVAEDAQGHISTSGITKNIEFVINDGAILYALWSYIYGYNEETPDKTYLKGTECIQLSDDGYLWLSKAPIKLFLYRVEDNENILIPSYKYTVVETEDGHYGIEYSEAKKIDNYLVSYEYEIEPTTISHIKQIHNNIFCAMDIYIDAVDLKNGDKHIVYIHCDKVQVDTDLVISINNSNKMSFTPIRIKSIAEGDELNKDIAKIVVI